MKEERVKASKLLAGPAVKPYEGDHPHFIEAVRRALYMSKFARTPKALRK